MANSEYRLAALLVMISTMALAIYFLGSETYLSWMAMYGSVRLGQQVSEYAHRRWPK